MIWSDYVNREMYLMLLDLLCEAYNFNYDFEPIYV